MLNNEQRRYLDISVPAGSPKGDPAGTETNTTNTTNTNYSFRKLSPRAIAHSERRLLTGFANAAFMAWKLMVASAMMMEANPPAANNHQLI